MKARGSIRSLKIEIDGASEAVLRHAAKLAGTAIAGAMREAGRKLAAEHRRRTPAGHAPAPGEHAPLRHAGSFRTTCSVCGQENVAHRADGEPYEIHRRGSRHQAALTPNHDD